MKYTLKNFSTDISLESKVENISKDHPFYVSTPYKMQYRDDSLFTKQYIEKIKGIIGDSKNFKKNAEKSRSNITKELEDLYNVETIWKYMVKKTQHSNNIVQNLFPNGVRQFEDLFNECFFPPKSQINDKKKRKKYGVYKAVNFLQNFTNYLFDNRETFPFLLTSFNHKVLTEADFHSIIKTMDPKIIFSESVKIAMKEAYTEGVAIEKKDSFAFFNQEIDIDCLKARRTDLHYPTSEFIALYMLTLLLDKFSELGALRSNSIEQKSQYLKSIANHMKFHMQENELYIKTDTQWFCRKDEITYLLLKFLEKTEVISYVTKEFKKIRSGLVTEVYVYVFNRKLETDLAISPSIPRLTPPKKAETQNCVEN